MSSMSEHTQDDGIRLAAIPNDTAGPAGSGDSPAVARPLGVYQVGDDHLNEFAEDYRTLAFQVAHPGAHISGRKLPQIVRDWLRAGEGPLAEAVQATHEELRALRVLEVTDAIDTIRDGTVSYCVKQDALALLRRRLTPRVDLDGTLDPTPAGSTLEHYESMDRPCRIHSFVIRNDGHVPTWLKIRIMRVGFVDEVGESVGVFFSQVNCDNWKLVPTEPSAIGGAGGSDTVTNHRAAAQWVLSRPGGPLAELAERAETEPSHGDDEIVGGAGRLPQEA